MKITYEPGDVVEVEDNIEAGKYAACTVKLLHKISKVWTVELIDCVGGMDPNDTRPSKVKEIWLNPR